MSDVFKFMTVRAVHRAARTVAAFRQISLASPPSGKTVARAVRGPITSLASLSVDYGALSDWLALRGEAPHRVELFDEIKALTQTTPDVFVAGATYQADKEWVRTSFLALLRSGGDPTFLIELNRTLRTMALLEALVHNGLPTDSEIADFLLGAYVVLPPEFAVPDRALARKPAVGDLRVVRQTLVSNDMGDIAYVENVVARETRSRKHVRTDVREETLSTETETVEDHEEDLQKSERFSLQQESSKVLQEKIDVQAGLNISASYGTTVTVNANASAAVSMSMEESSRTASDFARDVVTTAKNRVQSRVKETRSTRTQRTVEETNEHAFANTSPDHVVAVYRWIDKTYRAQVYNYGRRLLLEFVVPEPAAYYRYAVDARNERGIPPKPDAPTFTPRPTPRHLGMARDLQPGDLNRNNYLEYVAKYFVSNVKPPPPDKVFATAGWGSAATPDTGIGLDAPEHKFYVSNQSVVIPEGYEATKLDGTLYVSDFRENIGLSVGGHRAALTLISQGTTSAFSEHLGVSIPAFEGERGALAVAMVIENAWGYSISLRTECALTPEAFAIWQIDTYQAIMRAFFELKSQYDEAVAAAKIAKGVQIDGDNPTQNQITVRTEIKRSVVAMMLGSEFEAAPLDGDAINVRGPFPGPKIDFTVAAKERSLIAWMEEAFEWTETTFLFQPYFWARKSTWEDTLSLKSADPLFADFLRAGSARVVVPVRPGFERAVGLYVATGILWNGADAPQIDDPLYVSIVEEIREQGQIDRGGVAEGDPWTVVLPTDLVILQQGATL